MRWRRFVLWAVAVASLSGAMVGIWCAVKAWRSAAGRAPASWERIEVSPIRHGDWLTLRHPSRPACMAARGDVAWVGTVDGLVLRYDLTAGTTEWLCPFAGEAASVVAVQLDGKGDVWICSEDRQVARLAGGTFELMGELLSVAAKHGVFTVTDKAGNKWLTVDSAVQHRSPVEWPPRNVPEAMVHKDGKWLRFRAAFPSVWRTYERAPGWSTPPCGVVGPDAEGRIWLRGAVFEEVPNEAREAVGWVGCFDGERWHIHADHSVWRSDVNKLVVDGSGRIWVVGGHVVGFFDGGKLREFATTDQLREQFETEGELCGFSLLAVDSRGNAWMGVEDLGGLVDRFCAFDGQRFSLYDGETGLPESPGSIVALQADQAARVLALYDTCVLAVIQSGKVTALQSPSSPPITTHGEGRGDG